MRYVKSIILLFSVVVWISGCGANKNEIQKESSEIITQNSSESVDIKKGKKLQYDKSDITEKDTKNSLSDSNSQPLAENNQESSNAIGNQQNVGEENSNDSLVKPKTPKVTKDKTKNEKVLVIGEKMFITQINEIYYNFESYKDKTIVVEGMYALFYNFDGTENIPAVYRNGPGCCGNDGWGGFFLKYDGDLPQDNDWIKVTGTPILLSNGYYDDLYLDVTNIEVLTDRGAEFVEQ